jgi:uncharacterized protein YfaS (alpha-2-macroglobulin family)
MKDYLRLAVVLTAALFFASACKNKNRLELVARNFDKEVEQQQNLIFTFNKELVPDSLLQRWDSTAIIEFSPAVRGAFKWTSSSELMFSPAEGFQPGTDYTARLTKALLQRAPKKISLGTERYMFRTAPLRISDARVGYARGSGGSVVSQLDLEFNYPVKIREAAARIKASTNGITVPLTLINGGTGKTLSLQFPPLNTSENAQPLQVEVAKGVPMAAGKVESSADTVLTRDVPSRFTLNVTGLSSQHNGSDASIQVAFSQPVHDEGLKNFVTIEPAVPFQVAASNSGITITSDSMSPEQTYQVTIDHQLEGALGGRMKEDYSEQVAFGRLAPEIKFRNSKGMYLSSRGFKNVAMNVVAVNALTLTVVKVYENNLAQLMRKGSSYDYEYDYDSEDGGSFDYYNTENLGDTVYSGDFQCNKLPGQNAMRVLNLDFVDKLRERNGIYVITVADKDHYWVQSSKIISLSDIALIVKQERDAMYVFANSIRDAAPLSGTEINFISTNNQQMWHGNTDKDGMLRFDDVARHAPGYRTGLITAKRGDEYSFIWLDGSRVETSRFDVGGREQNASGLNAMIYAERDLYRPGEVAHVSTVVRTESWENPGEIPIKLRLVMPNGKEFGTMRKILNEEGSTETEFAIPFTAITGMYTLEVYSGNDVLLNSYTVSIEDFMPDRIKASLRVDKPVYQLGDSIHAFVQADNLFGTPAMNRNTDIEMNLSQASFNSRAFGDYDFSIRSDVSLESGFQQTTTDERGAAGATFGALPQSAAAGLINGRVSATVFDETGRPVHRYASFKMFTQPEFIGVRRPEDYVSTGYRMRFPVVVTDTGGRALSRRPVHVAVYKTEWNTVIEQSGDHYRYVSQEQTKVLEQSDIYVDGANTVYSYIPRLSGSYEVRFSFPNSPAYVAQRFYAWGYNDGSFNSFEVNNEGNVEIKPDKEDYRQGESINLLFTTPFEGRMLVTVERDKVLKYYFVQTNNKSASLKIPASDALVPNAYISATLFRPMDGAELPLTVAHGYRNITVENPGDKMPVSIKMVPASRSKTKQQINLKTAPGAYVTIAAVDEGILQVRNFKTPDAYAYFFQKVALAVGSFDVYPLLLPEINTTRMSTGGDGAGDDGSLRVNPLFVNRVRNVSFWSGILRADGSGNVSYTMDIPQFSGDIRVMALTYKGRRFGSAEGHMKVADPVVISAALPRVLSPRDEVLMPVTLSNTTAKDAAASVTLSVTGPLGVIGTSTQQVSLPANREGRAVFNIAAANSIGAARVLVTVAAMGERFTNETEIAVRPPASLQKRSGSGVAPAGKITAIQVPSNFIASSASGTFSFGKSPLLPFSKNLRDLIHYPYGCVEQTTSTAFPQLYYTDLVRSLPGNGNAAADPNPAYNVQQAIAKLQSMQLSSGGLSYWPGVGGEESYWGSVFAAHFLVEAKKAGYEVNSNTLSHLMQYLKAKLQKRETEVLYYNQNLSREIAAKSSIYSLYVLALAGEPQQATMNYYKGNLKHLAIDSRYLLGATYSLAGQPQAAKQVTPAAFQGEIASTAFGGSFYSYIRDMGVALNALIDTDPSDPQVTALTRELSRMMQARPYLNTQEQVWGLLALGKQARISNRTNATATLRANGRQVVSSNGTATKLSLKTLLNIPLQLSVQGSGQMYYFWEVQGLTADGSYKEEDAFLKVRRSYFDRNGKAVTTNTFRQNDLIVVKLSLQSQWNGVVENVVVTDMLPAGFEIENTRLNDLPDLKWVTNQATPDYIDYRDDRINMFASAGGQQKDFYYMVRAVSPGTYQLGPVQADAMYNGAFHSYNGAGVIKVLER